MLYRKPAFSLQVQQEPFSLSKRVRQPIHKSKSGKLVSLWVSWHLAYLSPISTGLRADTSVFATGFMKVQSRNRMFLRGCARWSYLLEHWATLTQCLKEPGAPLDNNIAERALKLAIRQRKNSLFYATEHSAYIASILTSVIATCVQAGVNALDYLVAIQEHRQEVFTNPSAWLPWNYEAALVPA